MSELEQPIYHLQATLFTGNRPGKPSKKSPQRTIAINSQDSLYTLAAAIVEAFDFDFDHAFGFFDNLGNPYNSKESYELFADLEGGDGEFMEDDDDEAQPLLLMPPNLFEGIKDQIPGGEDNPAFWVTKAATEMDAEALQKRYLEATRSILREELLKRIPTEQHPQVQTVLDTFIHQMLSDDPDESENLLEQMVSSHEQKSGSVKNTTVTQVFNQVGKKMLFLFDYGDEWLFTVELKKTEAKTPKTRYPKVVESVGKAPEQYGEW